MKIFILIFLCFLSLFSNGQTFVTQNDIRGVFLIQNKAINKFGSSFFISENDSHNYIVTAKHLFPNNKNGDTIFVEIFKDSSWTKIKGQVFYHDSTIVDIAVIKIKESLKNFNPYKLKSCEFILSDEAFFIGFPYGFKTSDKGKVKLWIPISDDKKSDLFRN